MTPRQTARTADDTLSQPASSLALACRGPGTRPVSCDGVGKGAPETQPNLRCSSGGRCSGAIITAGRWEVLTRHSWPVGGSNATQPVSRLCGQLQEVGQSASLRSAAWPGCAEGLLCPFDRESPLLSSELEVFEYILLYFLGDSTKHDLFM